MGLFFTDKPKVTKEEYQKVRNYLYSAGFTHKELDQVNEIFYADMNESATYEQGISREEIDKGIQWMRDNLHIHHIPESKISILEKELNSKL
jgi:hypothetical protein